MFLISCVTLQMSCQCTKMQYAQNNSTLIKLEFQAVMEQRCAQLHVSNIAFVYILYSAISMLLININIFLLKEIYHNPETKKILQVVYGDATLKVFDPKLDGSEHNVFKKFNILVNINMSYEKHVKPHIRSDKKNTLFCSVVYEDV